MARLPSRGGPGGGAFRMAERAGIRKGLNGSKPWFYVGTGLWTLRTVRKLAERKTEILVSERLGPGDTITIRNTPPPPSGRKARKAARKKPAGSQKQTRRERRAEAKQAAKAERDATGS
jgi:hypothetical protein